MDSNAIVSSTIRFEPPIEGTPADMVGTEGGLSVELEGERRVRLDPRDPRSPGFAEVLEGMQRLHLPVYVEFDPATTAITRLLVPRIVRVTGVHSTDEGTLTVEVEPSHARHVLDPSNPDASALERQLREALETSSSVILTEDDRHSIVDVRPFAPSADRPLPPFPEPTPPRGGPAQPWPLRLLSVVWDAIQWPWIFLKRPYIDEAQAVFDAMAAMSCVPTHRFPRPCIAFLYPDDGCWVRAHAMCRLLIERGLTPRKIWNEAYFPEYLQVNTRNNPDCIVWWGFHVAPTLVFRGSMRSWPPGQTLPMVMDPSLFAMPVSVATWKDVQGNPGSTLVDTPASSYLLGGGITDPDYHYTDTDLDFFQLQLSNRSNQFGPPPYGNCH
jgi:hypothetical protein